jgi:hypothetical protein
MNVINPNNTTHIVKLILRYTPDTSVVELYNEQTQTNTEVLHTLVITNGIAQLTFDFDFSEGDRYQIKITDINGVVYRGKLYATTQDTQDYKATLDKYYA